MSTTQDMLSRATIRFAGDSGDGMQLTGEQFTTTSAMMGEEVATFSDFPAEIRAPIGTTGGVSGFQLTFGADHVYSVGDTVDVLVVFNPAALKVNLLHLKKGGILIANKDSFTKKNLEKVGYEDNPLENGSLGAYQVFEIPISTLNKNALEETGLPGKTVERCKNFFALGLTYWLFQRKLAPTETWLERKFAKKPEIAEANKKALRGGWNVGESTELFSSAFRIQESEEHREPGTYRHVTGNKAIALGLLVAAEKAKRKLFLASYPITPATEILQEVSNFKNFGGISYQAEDEIAAMGAAVGAAFGGALAVTSTSGPGLALKSEALNLAMITELPLVLFNVQRGGPSTGLPTKMEQSDLLQALWGRNGESPVVVMAAKSPSDCFDTALEAARIAIRYMTPVVVLSDSSLANGAEVWRVADWEKLPEIDTSYEVKDMENFQPYDRNEETLARPWVTPGTAGGEHRIGGLEKEDKSGDISYFPPNHEKMVNLRAEKVARVANDLPELPLYGNPDGEVLVLGWGSTYGVIRRTVERLADQGVPVASTHLKYINPLPNDLQDKINSFSKVLIVEMNSGQLFLRIKGELDGNFEKLNKVQGIPFKEIEIEDKIKSLIG